MFVARPFILALLLLSLAAVPVRADDITDMKSQIKQLQEKLNKLESSGATSAKGARVVTAGDEEGTWKLPGSDTSVGIYGFIHLDLYTDAKGRQSADWAADIGSQPVNGATVTGNDSRSGKTNLTARTSRFGIKTLTPTEKGSMRTVLEADFNKNPSGSDGVLNNTQFASNYALRLRHAYGELNGDGGKLLAGQTWSTFMNMDSAPETVDFNGHASAAYVRQAQIRYTAKLGNAGELALAIENPHNAFDGGTAQAVPYLDKRPDLIANWIMSRSWGSLSVQALSTEYRYDNGTTTATANGKGYGIGGAFKPTDKDALLFQYTAGEGLGRYLPSTSWHIAVYDAAASKVRLYDSSSYLLAWARNWNDKMRTNLAYGATRIRDNWDSDFSDGYVDSREMTEGFANVITRIARNTEWGLEYSWGERETYAWTTGTGATGRVYSGERRRYQTSLHFAF